MTRFVLPLVSLALLTACPRPVDRVTIHRVVDRGRHVGDLGEACALGSSLSIPLAAAGTRTRPPHKALVVAEATAGLCPEGAAWEFELTEARLRARLADDPTVAGQVRDAQLAARREHSLAADRFYKAFQHTEAAFGDVGEGCPHLNDDESFVYLLGMVSGMLAMLHDGQGGGQIGVPLDTLAKVSRGATCLDDAVWWSSPMALSAAQGATIPGTSPEGVDPWAQLETAATAGEHTGVRVSRALQVLVAANAGREDVVRSGVLAHGASVQATPRDNEWALLDEFARSVTGHQADLIWTKSLGYRAPAFGTLPEPAAPPPPTAADPFSADPFGD